MRGIKFRAWHHGGGDPRVKGYMKYSKDCGLRIFFGNVESEVLAVEVMQFTGLHDKNGVEIYEGDLVVDRDSKQPAIVEYREDNCCFMLSSNSFVTKECVNRFQYKVIGNIHENPELLDD